MGITKEGWLKRKANGKGTAWNKGKKGSQVAWNKGKKLTKHPTMGFRKGHKCFTSREAFKRGGLKRRGKIHPLWKGGITPLRIQIWHSFKTRQWRSDVFTRDNFTCVHCNTRGEKLEAHHIKSASQIIEENKIKTFDMAMECEELWNINNGQTLCRPCHTKTENYGEKAKKWIKYTA